MVTGVSMKFGTVFFLGIWISVQLSAVTSLAVDSLGSQCSGPEHELKIKSCNAICGQGSCRLTKQSQEPVCECTEYPSAQGSSPENGIAEYECEGDNACMTACNNLTSGLTDVYSRPLTCSLTGQSSSSSTSSICACVVFEISVSEGMVQNDPAGETTEGLLDGLFDILDPILTIFFTLVNMITQPFLDLLTKFFALIGRLLRGVLPDISL